MQDIMPAIKRHFDGLTDRLSCFRDLEIQTEGWLKGELLFALSRLQSEGLLQDLDREVRLDAKRIDVAFRRAGTQHYIELKHWLIGLQRGFSYNSNFYFSDSTSVGLVPDVDKLRRTPDDGARWILILHTSNPGPEQWTAGIAKFNEKFAPRTLAACSAPTEFPDTYFLGLLRVKAT